MPRVPKKKRRKDANEDPDGRNKQKIKMKRIYKKGSCRYCGEKAHTKRNCPKKKAKEMAATAKSVVNPTHAISPADVPSQVGTHQKIQHQGQAEVELGMSQLIMSQNEDQAEVELGMSQLIMSQNEYSLQMETSVM
ncbi:hypothetical protein Ahy_B01g052568 [Arachis hypogaea]|uniref:CCHC-type domain-containing protein n=1 Tax=Arachis hypogaea TaxID=3818 RepID=A0A445APU4_ARAHY|nr:hypothetical protein Ahy_B01g052568 [Arachis hypogaea]